MEVNLYQSLSVTTTSSQFFSIPNSITYNKIHEFTRGHFEDQMSDMQLQILDKRLFTILNKNENFKKVEDDALSGNAQPLFNSIVEACEKLLGSGTSIWDPEVYLKTDRQYLIFNIIRGVLPSFKEIKDDSTLISSILWETNLELIEEARSLIQNLMTDMYRQFSDPDLKESDEFHLEMILGDLLSLYPFLRPKDGEVIHLPVKVEGVWRLLDYKTERIELTSDLLGSPLVAYGLGPVNLLAPPILLFKGTTYPSDEGAFLSLMTDINPFGSVGDYGFKLGRCKIEDWINRQTSTAKIVSYGKSLGGAQSWRLAINFPEKVGRVMSYGPPGFAPLELYQLYQVTDKYPELQINFFCQRNDLVPFSDCVAKKGVNYYEVLSAQCQNNPIAAHADMYSTHECSMILRMQPEYIQSPLKRAAVTVTRLSTSVLFPIGCIGVWVNATYRTTKFFGETIVKSFSPEEVKK